MSDHDATLFYVFTEGRYFYDDETGTQCLPYDNDAVFMDDAGGFHFFDDGPGLSITNLFHDMETRAVDDAPLLPGGRENPAPPRPVSSMYSERGEMHIY